MKSSEKTSELTKAMSEFQSRLVTLAKDSKAYNYNYTNLASIWESFRPLLHELGLFIFQDVVTCPEGVKVATRISHISDQWIETDYILVPMGKRDAHSTGSACTYGRRYSLSCALGIVSDEDDDGAAAQKAAPKEVEKPKIVPYTQKQIDNWVNKWGRKYKLNNIVSYLDARADHLNHSIGSTVAELANDETTFVKNMDKWIKQQKDSENTES